MDESSAHPCSPISQTAGPGQSPVSMAGRPAERKPLWQNVLERHSPASWPWVGGERGHDQEGPERFSLRRDVGLLLILLLLATGIRFWLITHTEVTSRDSIGYERYAWELRQDNWNEVLRRNVHHPLYPLTILAVSVPMRQVAGGSEVAIMQLSAQLASGLAGILSVIPMFFLGKEMFDRRVGFWSSAIFQCLPVGARVMSDALSESLFLLVSATALLLAVRGFRTGSIRHFALCGLCAGLAYLTRPEGVLVAAAVLLCVMYQFRKTEFIPFPLDKERNKFRSTTTSLAGLIMGFAVLAGPYMATIGGFSNKTTTQDVLQNARWAESSRPAFEILRSIFDVSCSLEHRDENQFPISNKEYRISRFPLLTVVGIWWPDGKVSDGLGHLGWSLYALGGEIGKGFFYVAWIPALFGLWAFRARVATEAGRLVLTVLCLLQCLALLRVAFVAGYVSDRHVLIIVLCGMYWAVAAVFHLIESIRAKKTLFSRLRPSAVMLFLLLMGLALPKTLAPLHANRAGHHAVGLWLAAHITPVDEIEDPFCWAAHYAGRTFCRHAGGPVANAPGSEGAKADTFRYRYVVHECRPDHREHFRKPSSPVADLVGAGGKAVYSWPEQESLEDAKIVLFAVPIPVKKYDKR